MKKKKLMLLVCALVVGLGVSLANADIETGLTGYWPFEEGEGTTTADASSYDHYGTLINGPTWAVGMEGMGGAILFDGVDDYIDCNSLISTETEELTISAWVYYDRSGVDSRYTLLSHRDEWDDMMFHLLIRSQQVDGKYYPDKLLMSQGVTGDWPNNWCWFRDDTGMGAAVVPQLEWVHVVVTCNGAEAEASAYFNGEFIETDAFSLPDALSLPTGPACKLLIGWSTRVKPDPPYNNQEIFCGLLDDIRLYDRILSADDIQELYEFRSDPDYNLTPKVEAGDYQSLLWPDNLVQLDATVSDDGKPDPPADLTYTWSKISGPGDVTFDPCNTVEAPIATFTAVGTYELRLSVSDSEKDACDMVAIQIRPNDDPIAHWDFEEGIGDTVDDESDNNNVGVLSGNSEPNWVSGWVGSWATEFYADDPCGQISYVDITSDILAGDPNLETLRYDITLSAWFKIGDLAITSSPVIVANGDQGWRLYANHSDGSIVFTPGDGVITDWTKRTTSVKLLDDGYWHHAVGIYDYANSKSYLYIDGELDTTTSEGAAGMMAEADDKPVTIGARATSATAVARGWNGRIDDVQVYSYCISEAKIAELAAMGDLVPQVNAGEDQTVSLQDGAIQLAGTATDDGKPSPSLDIEWTSDPCNPGTVTFDPCDAAVATATFSEAGEYILSLTAYDGHAVVSDDVTIIVNDPTCQDVIDDGFLIVGDISGSEGTPDCHVDLYDFAVFAGEWLSCNNPSDIDCEYPF